MGSVHEMLAGLVNNDRPDIWMVPKGDKSTVSKTRETEYHVSSIETNLLSPHLLKQVQ